MHLQLLLCSARYVFSSTLATAFGLPLNPKAAAEAEKVLLASLDKIESFWLQRNGRFLLGSSQPSIADISLVCEIMQLEVEKLSSLWFPSKFIFHFMWFLPQTKLIWNQIVEEKDRDRILSPYSKVQKWIDDTKKATMPHFDEIHAALFRLKQKLQKQRSERANLPSKM